MTTVNKYRLFCQTEGVNVYKWGESTPTTCPNNAAHTITPSSMTIVDTIEKNLVRIQEENILTGGNYQLTVLAMDCPANTITEKDFTYPHAITILAGYIYTTADYTGNIINVEVGTNTTTGSITASTISTDTVINVSSTVIDNVKMGHYVRFADGINTSTRSLVLSVDSVNNTITLQNQIGFAFDVATPTLVQMTVLVCKDHEFGEPGRYTIGEHTINGSYIPKDVPLKVIYDNTGSTTKRVRYCIETYY